MLYLDPTFGLAAFALGRAHEASGDASAARRAYQQALRTIDMTDERHDHLLEQVDLVDVATACRARLATSVTPADRLSSNAVSSASAQSDTILVADDSMTILAMASSRLERAGYDIVTATRGDDALRLVQESRPRLVLLDVEMPGLDGVEVARRIRADEALAGTFIVLLTSLSEETDVEAGNGGGRERLSDQAVQPAGSADAGREADRYSVSSS